MDTISKSRSFRELLEEDEIASVDAFLRLSIVIFKNASGLDNPELLDVNKGVSTLSKLFYETE